MAGLPFTKLPGSDNSPERMFEQRTKEGQQRIQQEFQFEWNNINEQARVNRMNRSKHQQLLNKLQVKSQRKAFEFNQKVQADAGSLKELDQLAKTGAITNATEAKWRIILGPEAEQAMFPKQERTKSPMQQFSELDVYRNRLESNIKEFRIMPAGEIKGWKPQRGGFIRSAIGAVTGFEKMAPEKLQIFDPSKLAYDAKGKVKESSVQGAWRRASLEETQQYGVLSGELKRVTAEQNSLINPKRTSNLMGTAATSPRMGGAIKDQAKAYLDQREGQGQQELDDNTAMQILQEAGGDKEQARQIARSRGYRL